jgi:hypothetical protein
MAAKSRPRACTRWHRGLIPSWPRCRRAPSFKVLAATEIGTGTALLVPLVSNKLAGAALTAFAGSLVGMYLRTPALRKPGSVWPSQSGTGVSKDIWILGIGLGLLADGPGRRSAATEGGDAGAA